MFSNRYKRYVTAVLLVIYICNQTDRSLFPFLMETIKHELNLTDTQLGFVAGPALVLLYAALGVPIARWGDRSQRIHIMTAAIVVWSCMVALFASVTSFGELALAQVGVGIGEAGFSAIAISVLADYHPRPEERARALSIFVLAVPISSVVSGLLAGWVSQALGWRAVFIAAALPGLLLALLMKTTVKEPRRAGHTAPIAPKSVAAPLKRATLSTVLRSVWSEPTLRHLSIAQFLASIVVFSMGNWLPPFFVRAFGLSQAQLGTWFAIILGGGGGLGIILSGSAAAAARAANDGVRIRSAAWATAVVAPMLLFSLWCPWQLAALLVLIPAQALMYFFLVPTMSAVQTLSPPGMAATMASVFILVQVIAGGVVGVQLVGSISDALQAMTGDGVSSLRWSLALTAIIALWAAAHLWRVADLWQPVSPPDPAAYPS